jgi:hypothetical protein
MEWSLNIPVIILKTSTEVTMNSIGSKNLMQLEVNDCPVFKKENLRN